MGDTNMDYSQARFWFDILQTIGVLVLAVYTWLTNRHKANRDAITQVDKNHKAAIEDIHGHLHEINRKVDLQERDIRHLPNHEDISRLHEKVNKVGESIKEVQGELKNINRTMALVNDHLLNGKR